jgi:hypothetical protein
MGACSGPEHDGMSAWTPTSQTDHSRAAHGNIPYSQVRKSVGVGTAVARGLYSDTQYTICGTVPAVGGTIMVRHEVWATQRKTLYQNCGTVYEVMGV